MITQRCVIGRISATTLLAAGLLIGTGTGEAAHASPLDPGLNVFPQSLVVPYCAAPRASDTRAGWSYVTCAVGRHQFVVPPGVHVLEVDVRGAAGGAGGGGAPGGWGQQIHASITVSPGQRLELAVGGAGDSHENGGFNGGGDGPRPGATGVTASGGGGGSSDVRVGDTGPWTRIVSAAGGGGGGAADGSDRNAGGRGGGAGRAGLAGPRALGGAAGGPATTAGQGAGGGTGASAGTDGSTDTLIGGSGGIGAASAVGTREGSLPDAAGDGGGGGGGYGFGGGGAGGATALLNGSPVGGGGGGGGGGSSSILPAYLSPGVAVQSVPAAHERDGAIVVTYHAPPIQCGQTITSSSTLTTDLHCGSGPGLTIGGQVDGLADSGIVFDLGGHTIYGDRFSGGGIFIDESGVTVRNGTLNGFYVGISWELNGYFAGNDAGPFVFSHLRLVDGVIGLQVAGSAALPSAVTVDHSVITRTSDGIEASGPGTLRITDSTLSHDNTGVDVNGPYVTAIADTVSDNFGSGFYLRGGFDLERNLVTGNSFGMTLITPFDPTEPEPGSTPDPYDGLVVSANTVDSNTIYGISLTGLIGSGALADNTTDQNGTHAGGSGNGGAPGDGDGIFVDLGASASGLTVSGNTAVANDDWGIDAAGVTDQGGNRASGNAVGEQCRGVTCTTP